MATLFTAWVVLFLRNRAIAPKTAVTRASILIMQSWGACLSYFNTATCLWWCESFALRRKTHSKFDTGWIWIHEIVHTKTDRSKFVNEFLLSQLDVLKIFNRTLSKINLHSGFYHWQLWSIFVIPAIKFSLGCSYWYASRPVFSCWQDTMFH